MKTEKIHLRVLGMVIAALAAMPAAPAMAKDRQGGRDDGRQTAAGRPDRDERGSFWQHDGRDQHGRVSFQIGSDRPGIVQRWTPGHFEMRIERVLVEEGHFVTQAQQVLLEAGHWEDRCIPAATETRRDYRGRIYTAIVVPARTERVWVAPVYNTLITRVWCPPRYEDRQVRVWVNGCYVTEQAPFRAGFTFRGIFGW